MWKLLRNIALVMITSIFGMSSTSEYQNKEAKIELIVKGIRNEKGVLLIGIFKDEENFKKNKPYKHVKYRKSNMRNGNLKLSYSLTAGIYGFTLLDDENENGLMDFNMIGLPVEGYGFANYYHSGLTRPKFDSFKTEIYSDSINKFEIKIKYFF